MTLKEAVKVVTKAVEAEMQRHAVNANLFEQFHLQSGRPAYEYRQELQEAINVLRHAVMPRDVTP